MILLKISVSTFHYQYTDTCYLIDRELVYVYADMYIESLLTNVNMPNNQVEKGQTHTQESKHKVNTTDF